MAEREGGKRHLQRLRSFLLTTIIGGIVVVLPIGLLLVIARLIYNFLSRVLTPVRDLIAFPPGMGVWVINLISIAIIVLAFFLIGLIVRTGIGNRVHTLVDRKLLGRIPFYSALRDTVNQFFGRKRMPFAQVVIAEVMNTRMTGFVTDDHEDGTYTIFVPTAPNPTNGFIFHVRRDQLRFLNVRADEAMRTVFALGAGSSRLFGHDGPPQAPAGAPEPSPPETDL